METIEEVVKKFGVDDIADYIIGNHFDEVKFRLDDNDAIDIANDKLSDSQKVYAFKDAFELNDLDPSEEDALEYVYEDTLEGIAKDLNTESLGKNPAKFLNELLCDHFGIAYTTEKRTVLLKLHELFKVAPAKCVKSSFCSDFEEEEA